MGCLGNYPKLLVLRSWDETLSFLTVCGFGRYIRLYAGWLAGTVWGSVWYIRESRKEDQGLE